MRSVNDKLKDFFTVKNLNLSEAERVCGLKNQTLGVTFKRGSSMGVDKIEAILAAFPDLSAEWLLRGEGEMIKKEPEENKENIDYAHICKQMADMYAEIQRLNALVAELKGEKGRIAV